MKVSRKFISFLLVFTLLLPNFLFSTIAFPGNYWWYPNNMHARIYHPASGKYLGIQVDQIGQNGARLELQDYQEGNPYQIFYIKKIATDKSGHSFYQIRVHGEDGKIIEVRNSSHDDYAEVAQWDEHYGYCAIWSFFTEKNESKSASPVCCIKNYESQKLMNVARGEHHSGNKIIQHHEDGTTSEEFQIINVEDQVVGAIWEADWNNRGIFWSGVENTKKNREKYDSPITNVSEEYVFYPHADPDTWYLAKVLYLDSNMQKKIILDYNEDWFKEFNQHFKDSVGLSSAETVVGTILEETVLDLLPLDVIWTVAETLATGYDREQWRKLVTAFRNNTNVRLEIYYKFESDGWSEPIVTFTAINDDKSVYWDGKASSIDTEYYDYNGDKVNGNIKYFYK